MASEANHSQVNQVIRIYCAQTKQLVHELPEIVSEVELVEASRKDKAKRNLPLEKLCSMILERLSTSVEGSVYHVDDFCNAFREKRNVGVQIYDLFNVLESIGYLKKVKKGTFKWFGPESEQAAKTFRDLKTFAFNHDSSVDSDDDDDESSTKRTIPRLTEKVVMIFLRAKPTQTISFHQIFVQVFKKEYQAGLGQAALTKVVTVLEVLGLIVHVDRSEGAERKGFRAGASYRYAGPAIDGYSSFEEIGKNEVDTEHEDLVEDTAPKKELETGEYFEEIGKIEADTDYEDLEEMDSIQEETAPKKELVLDEDGNWSVQDYIPISYADNVVSGEVLCVCKEEDMKSDSD